LHEDRKERQRPKKKKRKSGTKDLGGSTPSKVRKRKGEKDRPGPGWGVRRTTKQRIQRSASATGNRGERGGQKGFEKKKTNTKNRNFLWGGGRGGD